MQTLLGGVTFIVDEITAAAPADYETALLTNLSSDPNADLSESVKQLRGNAASLPLQTTPDQPLSDAELRLIDLKVACAMLDIEAAFPLLPGELVEGEPGKGILSAEWQHLPAGTPVVTRTTNFRTIHLASQQHRFVNNALVDARPSLKLKSSNPCWGWDRPVQDDSATAYIFEMINTLLGLSEIGLVFTPFISMFADQATKGISWDDVVKTAKCAAEQISKTNDVEILKGSLAGLNNELTTTYMPIKNRVKGTTGDARTKNMQDAYSWGSSIITSMTSTLGALSADNLGAAALVAYVSGAGTIIGLYQDLSTVDAASPDPAQSGAIEAMRNFANTASAYVQNAVDGLAAERSDAIQLVEETQPVNRCSGGMSPTCVQIGTRVSGYHWEDRITGDHSGTWKVNYDYQRDEKRNACIADLNNYKGPLISKFRDQLAPLLKAAQAFKGATIPHPIP
ncbi:hypothetical protein SAMN04487996_101285 [Dyadobacter soli]|uniref:Uncharacterized protein n=1 Tax=Dyadobacter soli TaxID=659014 RepID=A0A1G6VLZ8_9BACT|nr:hypothetical protein [Dyadobacter soli]SDD54660.1 hypothetical protein SAMN04487996_101285 [Dyadobacter soli]